MKYDIGESSILYNISYIFEMYQKSLCCTPETNKLIDL